MHSGMSLPNTMEVTGLEVDMVNMVVAAKVADAEEVVVVAGEEEATPEDFGLLEVTNIASTMATVRT